MSRVEQHVERRVEQVGATVRGGAAWSAGASRAPVRLLGRPTGSGETIECAWRVVGEAISIEARTKLAQRGLEIGPEDKVGIVWRVERGVGACCVIEVRGHEIEVGAADSAGVEWVEQIGTGLTHVEVPRVVSPLFKNGHGRALAISLDGGWRAGLARVVFARTGMLGWLEVAGGRYDLAVVRVVHMGA